MTWLDLIPVIASQGLVVAEKIWQLWASKADPTQADWDTLKVLGKENSRSRMLLALANAGINPESEQGKAFLALVNV